MAQHEVEIRITKEGEVRVHVKGAKGKACQAYAKWFADLIGKVQKELWTSERYEPEVKAKVDIHQDLMGK